MGPEGGIFIFAHSRNIFWVPGFFASLEGTDKAWDGPLLCAAPHPVFILSSFQAGKSYEQLKEELGDAAAITRITAVRFLEEQ